MKGKVATTRENVVDHLVVAKLPPDQVADPGFGSLQKVPASRVEGTETNPGNVFVFLTISEVRQGDIKISNRTHFDLGRTGNLRDCSLSVCRNLWIENSDFVSVAALIGVLNAVDGNTISDVAIRFGMRVALVGIQVVIYPDKGVVS